MDCDDSDKSNELTQVVLMNSSPALSRISPQMINECTFAYLQQKALFCNCNNLFDGMYFSEHFIYEDHDFKPRFWNSGSVSDRVLHCIIWRALSTQLLNATCKQSIIARIHISVAPGELVNGKGIEDIEELAEVLSSLVHHNLTLVVK